MPLESSASPLSAAEFRWLVALESTVFFQLPFWGLAAPWHFLDAPVLCTLMLAIVGALGAVVLHVAPAACGRLLENTAPRLAASLTALLALAAGLLPPLIALRPLVLSAARSRRHLWHILAGALAGSGLFFLTIFRFPFGRQMRGELEAWPQLLTLAGSLMTLLWLTSLARNRLSR